MLFGIFWHIILLCDFIKIEMRIACHSGSNIRTHNPPCDCICDLTSSAVRLLFVDDTMMFFTKVDRISIWFTKSITLRGIQHHFRAPFSRTVQCLDNDITLNEVPWLVIYCNSLVFNLLYIVVLRGFISCNSSNRSRNHSYTLFKKYNTHFAFCYFACNRYVKD